MFRGRPSKERLVRLLNLVQVHRGWSQRELARRLGRDPHNLIPNREAPRLDLVLGIADALGWSPGDVVDDLCVGDPASNDSASDVRLAIEEARELLLADRFEEALTKARCLIERDCRVTERAYACLTGSAAAEGLGLYSLGIELVQRGLRDLDSDSSLGLWLRSALASLHYALGQLCEASAIAAVLQEQLGTLNQQDPRRSVLGHALSVRGHCDRVRAGTTAADRPTIASRAIALLTDAAGVLRLHEQHGGSPTEAAAASICDGGVIELQVLLGLLDGSVAVDRCMSEVDEPTDASRMSRRWAEARAWWCIFGCNIALRHVRDLGAKERALAIFTNKADELAAVTGNWVLREQIWRIEHLHRRQRDSERGSSPPWVLDQEDLGTLAGVMGRFPGFRAVGWAILDQVDAQEERS